MIHLWAMIRESLAHFLICTAIRVMTDEMIEDWAPYLMAASQKSKARAERELQILDAKHGYQGNPPQGS